MQIQLNSRETELLKAVAEAAAKIGVPAFAVGGFVRDKLLGRPTKDIDVVCIGDGMVLAQTFSKLFHPTMNILLKTISQYLGFLLRTRESAKQLISVC